MRTPMKRFALTCAVGLSCVASLPTHPALGVAGTAASKPTTPSSTRAGEAIARFGFELFARVAPSPGNACVSPLSVAMALAMAREGASGTTAQQMSATLHLGPEPSAEFSDLRRQLAPRDSAYELDIANALWVGAATPLESAYRSKVEKSYGARLQPLDFSQPGAASDTINAWVAKATRGRIPGLVTPGALSPATRLVITNATYFAGRWEHAFEKAATRDEDFHSPKATIQAPFMQATRSYGYADDARVQLLELPYAGDRLQMLLILPRSAADLEPVERDFTLPKLNRWLAAMKERSVEVHLPRFRFDADCALERELPALGMLDAFDPARADFSGIDGRRDLFIGAVIHRTFVAVDEQGTTAAAATGVIMPTAIIRPMPVVFRADHPFLFVIRDPRTGVVLFLGRLEQPES